MLNKSRTRIMIVEDHPAMICGLCRILEDKQAYKIVATAQNPEEARRRVKNTKIDLVIMDIRLKSEVDGIDLTAELHTNLADLRVLIYTDEKYVEFVRRALRTGARGYLLKDSGIVKIRRAVDTVRDGSIFLDEDLPELPGPELDPLTEAEERVLRRVAQWQTTKQIAYELEIRVPTVKSHKKNIISKLGLRGSHELEREAIRRYGNPDDRGAGNPKDNKVNKAQLAVV